MSKAKPKVEKVCPVCGGTFLSSRDNARYCSKKCYKRANNVQVMAAHKRRNAERNPVVEKVCAICGGKFMGRSQNIYCSNKCRRGAFFRVNVVAGLADTAEEEMETHKLFPSIVETIRELGYSFKVMPQRYMREHNDAVKAKRAGQMPHAKHTPEVSALLARVANAEAMAKQYRELYLAEKRKQWTALGGVNP